MGGAMAGRWLLWVAMLAVVGFLCGVGQASAYIYWDNYGWENSGPGGIGRANLDGSNPTEFFIPSADAPSPHGVAVDRQHIYWAGGGIGRANLDGSNPTNSFIPGGYGANSVAVDGQHIYWANGFLNGGIGRANLDGSNPTEFFIPKDPASLAYGVAVDSQRIYWGSESGGGIFWANLNGAYRGGGIPFTYAPEPTGVAVDGQHIYWANGHAVGGIGRANLDGSNPTEFFIPSADAPSAAGVAVDGQYIYWADTAGGIGRANLDGSNPTEFFIPSADAPSPISVAADATGSNSQSGKVTRRCVVPSLNGDTLLAARSALRRAHCKLGKVTRPHKHHGTPHVISQSPKKGKRLKAGSAVAVTLK
jgi:virginiamycin B lyase